MDNQKHFSCRKNKGTNAIPMFTCVESNIDSVEKERKIGCIPAGIAEHWRKNLAAFARKATGLKAKSHGVLSETPRRVRRKKAEPRNA